MIDQGQGGARCWDGRRPGDRDRKYVTISGGGGVPPLLFVEIGRTIVLNTRELFPVHYQRNRGFSHLILASREGGRGYLPPTRLFPGGGDPPLCSGGRQGDHLPGFVLKGFMPQIDKQAVRFSLTDENSRWEKNGLPVIRVLRNKEQLRGRSGNMRQEQGMYNRQGVEGATFRVLPG